MIRPPPPIRFLVGAVAGWTALRFAIVAPSWSNERPSPAESVAPGSTAAATERRGEDRAVVHAAAARIRDTAGRLNGQLRSSGPLVRRPGRGPISLGSTAQRAAPEEEEDRPGRLAFGGAYVLPSPLPPTSAGWMMRPPSAVAMPPAGPAPGPLPPSRWSFSAWTFLRAGGEGGLALGGALGGSQAGGRLTYRLAGTRRPLALSARIYAPVHRPQGSEAALGLDWSPLPGLPLHLLAARRQAAGREGRSAFDLTAYGGVDDVALGRLRLDAYGQAGIVGRRSRDLFADGAARLTLPLGRAAVGVGAWAAAQPGVARLDVGPHARILIREGPAALIIAADWRFRLSGRARPGSGPALTVSTQF